MTEDPEAPSDKPQDKAPDQAEDYFESMTVRLDSAIAAKLAGLRPPSSQAPATPATPALSEGPAATEVEAPDAAGDFPTLTRVLDGGITSPAPPTPPAGASPVARAFAALLALEEGQPGARPVRLVPADGEARITDDILEELTRRVIDRLGSTAARELVVEVVSEVAERLVRAEIERIRKKHV